MDVKDREGATPTDPSLAPNAAPKAALGEAQSHALVDSLAAATCPRLCSLLQDMYAHIEDTLFDFADRAYNNNEQALYFEAMREIRRHKAGAEKVFRQSIENGFQRLKERAKRTESSAELEAETLALVDTDEMELDVATSTMVHRARCDFPTALLQLTTRLNTLLSARQISETTNPLDPKQIVRAFTQATQHFDITLKVRLILYKEFEKYVLRQLEDVLYAANEILINAGILPDIRATISRSNSSQNAAPQQTVAAAHHREHLVTTPQIEPSSQETVRFETLQSLLAATNNLQGQSVYIQTDPAQPALTHATLLNWLTSLQAQRETGPPNTRQQPASVRQQLFDKLQAEDPRAPHNRLQQLDDHVINVVDMIFEFIFDQDIPAPMAALIGRLQIPVLKVAIRDQGFFDSQQHPARRLVNDIAQAALGWDAISHYEQDPLYQKVETIVKTVLSHEHPSVDLFMSLEEDFRHYAEGESQRSERLANRSADAEEGRAKADAARRQIEQLIHDRVHGKELPPVVLDLLETPWQKYLLQVHLKFGVGSEAWRIALNTADDLLWSVRMHTEPKSRQRWIRMLPGLLENLKAGLIQIAHSPVETEKMLGDLWEIHSRMLSHKGSSNPVDTVKVDLTHRQTSLPMNPLIKRGLSPDTIRALRKQVSSFQIGDWFAFQQIDNNIIRCRLVRKIRANDSFVFANRYGAMARAISKDQLGLYLHENKAKRLDNGPLIDRALQAVMLRLKHSLP